MLKSQLSFLEVQIIAVNSVLIWENNTLKLIFNEIIKFRIVLFLNTSCYAPHIWEDKYKVDESLFFFYFSSFEESRVKVKVEALEDIA